MNTDVMFSSATDEWATPQDFFDKMNAEFHFETDVCATPQNAKCKRYFTKEQDGLSLPWGGAVLDEPALRTKNRAVGEESMGGGANRGYSGLFAPGANRYRMVA